MMVALRASVLVGDFESKIVAQTALCNTSMPLHRAKKKDMSIKYFGAPVDLTAEDSRVLDSFLQHFAADPIPSGHSISPKKGMLSVDRSEL